MIGPGIFDPRFIYAPQKAQIVSRVFLRHGRSIREIQEQPRRSRHQVFQGDHSGLPCPAERPGAGAEDVDAKSRVAIDQLQQRFSRRRMGMNVPEQKIFSQSFRNIFERAGNEIHVVPRACRPIQATPPAVELKGQSAGERPLPDVVPGQLTKYARNSHRDDIRFIVVTGFIARAGLY